MNSIFILMPITGALIGWVTNLLAIKSLFHPRRPISIGPWVYQGLLPKRQRELASSIGKIVEEELLTAKDLSQRIQAGPVKDRLISEVMLQTEVYLAEKLPRVLHPVSTEFFLPLVRKESQAFLDRLLDRAEDFILQEAKLREIVEERVNSFEIEGLERLVLEVAGRELRHIELLGAVLGGLIGLVQAYISILLR